MKKYKLLNGLTVILDSRPGNSVAAIVTVRVGSNSEPDGMNGISHLIEHAVFLGTKRRRAMEISNQIEGVGGELNAATSPEKTFFYVKTLPRHLGLALDVLSDIVLSPSFPARGLEREKRVVAEEIDFVYDDYSFYQWVLFQKALFAGPQSNPVYGSKQNVLSLRRNTVAGFHAKHYVPGNIILTIVGKLPQDIRGVIRRHFSAPASPLPANEAFVEPKQTLLEERHELPTQSSYLVLGYKLPGLGSNEAIGFDLFDGVIGRGQSGRLFNEVRNKRGLAYSVGAYHNKGYQYNFFALYANLQKKNIPKVKTIFLSELSRLKKLNAEALRGSKIYTEGDFFVRNEDNLQWAQSLTQWELAGSAENCLGYVNRMKRYKLEAARELAKASLGPNYCMTAIVPGKPA
jgi:predicted Zn-dependent peptidase